MTTRRGSSGSYNKSSRPSSKGPARSGGRTKLSGEGSRGPGKPAGRMTGGEFRGKSGDSAKFKSSGKFKVERKGDDRDADAPKGPRKSNGRSIGDQFREGDRKKSYSKFHTDKQFYGRAQPGRLSVKKSQLPPQPSIGTRLNKYIANAGICSRREADKIIESGVVSINNEVVTQLGTKVMPGDVVTYAGEKLRSEQLVYVLLNKPKDFITTTDDPNERRTVMQLVKNACKERIYPVGRLDRNTTGLLLFTNDGDLAKKMTHPKHEVKKIYHVHTEKNVTVNDLRSLLNGVELEDGMSNADKAVYVGDGADKKQVGVELHSGRNRVVRRMFESLGHKVLRLDRVYLAGLTKKDLPRGRWKVLSEKELAMLKMIV